MKRVISILLVLVLTVSVVSGIAAKDTSKMDTAEDMLKYMMSCMKTYAELYRSNPYSFNDEYAETLYSYLIAYNAMRSVYQSEIYLGLPEESVEILKGITGPDLINARHEYREDLENMYYEWQSGNMTRKEFLEMLMKYVSSAINTYDTVNMDETEGTR